MDKKTNHNSNTTVEEQKFTLENCPWKDENGETDLVLFPIWKRAMERKNEKENKTSN